MKKLIFLIVLAFGLVTQLMAQNMNTDYVILDQSAPNLAQLQAQFSGQANVFLNDNGKPAPYVIAQILMSHQVVDLHIYSAAQPGSLMFNSVTITAANASDYSQDFASWHTNVSGKVVIHDPAIFTTAAGAALKTKLQELTTLVFSVQ